MTTFRKIFTLLTILLGSLLLGCGTVIEKENKELKDIFNKEGTYLVVFYDGEEIQSVNEYCESKKNGKIEYPVYMIDVSKETSFLRSYEGIDGQGVNKNFYVDGVSKVEDLYIATIPSVIKVSKTATFVADGIDNIDKYFKGLYAPYKITFDLDGGKFSSKISDEFYEGNEYVMPVPVKEGYIFLGFKENNEYVDKLESRDYKLRAVWTERFEYDVIKDTEVLTQEEDRYLVYVMKDNCSYCDKTKDWVLRYIYLQKNVYENAPKLYVVNITGSSILNKSTPTLMEVTTINDKKISEDIVSGATSVKNKLNEILYTKDEVYTINVNYGDEEISYSFKSWQEPILPDYEKEGYVLIGYEENGKFIENISKKSYELNAVFMPNTYETIDDKNVFMQEENHYLVYFMKDGCSYCDKIKKDINKYLYLSSKDDYSKSLSLYVVNLKTNGYTSSILNSKGHTDTYINGVTNWEDLYVSGTPTLIEVKSGVAKLIEIGSTKIVNALDNLLVSKDEELNNDTYKVEFDLGYNGETIQSLEFYSWQTATSFPTPEREGYIFLGWLLEDEVVTSVSGENVTLTAKWVSADTYKLIDDKDVFNQKPNRYLVFFKKDGCTYCERIEKDILEYSIDRLDDKYKNSLQLFIVNLKTNGYTSPIISNKNYDEVHVNGVTDWKDLYVPSTPTLIEVYLDNGVSTSKLVAVGSTKIVNALDDYLVKNGDPVGEKKSYTITIYYGYDNIVEVVQKYENSNYVLPTLSRDGYVFAGFEENGNIITEIENRNYNLKAIWKGIEDLIQIQDKDIFNQENSEYYILFVEKGSNTYDKVIKLALEYQFGNERDVPLYVVDIKDSDIKRGYTETGGEGYNNKFYVTNCKSWDELYIYATPSMIKITKGEDVSVTYLNCHLTSVTKFIETLIKE